MKGRDLMTDGILVSALLTALVAGSVITVFALVTGRLSKPGTFKGKPRILLSYLFFILFSGGAAFLVAMIWGMTPSEIVDGVRTWVSDVLSDNIGPITGSVITVMVAMAVVRLSAYTLKAIGEKESPTKQRRQTISKVLQSILRYTVLIITGIVILSMWGVDVAPALAGLGIIGLVIGLGAQKLIGDVINGFFIIFEQHYNVGERVEIQGYKGDVIDIGLKTTKVMGWKGDVRIFNNGDISSVTNFSRHFSVATAPFSISYESDMQKTIDILTSALKDTKERFPVVIDDPVVLGVTNLADSAVEMLVTCKTEAEQHYAVERYLKQRIKEILDENAIEIPFPQIVVSNKD
jgi:moderate conductance mechanosensitive channel